MEIVLENIAKIKRAHINIRGITVIAGENDTGKSTVSKALFSMFHGFYHLYEKIRRDRKVNLARSLRRIATSEGKLNYSQRITINLSSSLYGISSINEMKYFEDMAEELLSHFSSGKLDSLSSDLEDFLKENYGEIFSDDLVPKIVSKVIDLINVSDVEIGKVILSQTMNIEFYNQINSLYSKGEGKVLLTIKHKTNSVTIRSNRVIQFNEEIPVETDVIYLDNPLIVDQVPVIFPRPEEISFHNMGHREWLIWSLQNKLKYPYLDRVIEQSFDSSATREIIVEQHLKKIYEKLDTICRGEVTVNNRFVNEWAYQIDDSENVFLKNLSTGLKTFVILKSLLQNGTLSYGSTLILDEPEIHEHPEWQLVLAELIVLLHKEFQVHILLNTHSPYFLRAVEVYSQKHGISEKCDYYLAGLQGNESEIKNVNGCTEQIYKKLWSPFQKLENEGFLDE